MHLPTLETIFDVANALSRPASEFLEDAGDKRRVSRERIKLEAQLREIGRSLNDCDLAIAIAQASVFLRSGR